MSALWLWLVLAMAQEAPIDGVEPPADAVEAPTAPSEAPDLEAAVPEDSEAEDPVEEVPEEPAAEEPAPSDPPAHEADPDRSAPILEYGPSLPEVEEPEAPGFIGPMPAPEPPVVVLPAQEEGWSVSELMPRIAPRGFGPGSLLLLLALSFTGLAELFQRVRSGLADRGLLPALSSGASVGSRVLAVFFGLGALAAWVPASLAPALPWVIVGGALALGWSARDLLPDVVSWLALSLEGRVRPGRWVSGSGFRGEVVRVGPRATVFLDEWGAELSVPNRRLTQDPYGRDPSHWPKLEMELHLDPGLDGTRAREAIRQAVLLSPWVAPGEIEIGAAADGSGQWLVRARLLEGTYLAVFEGSLRERVLEVLEAEG